jgi:isocitrate dehydrogenase
MRRVKIPAGEKISISHGKLQVPHHPILPFIEGDGTGPDIWKASVRVLDAAVEQAYGGQRRIAWAEVYAGEKAQAVYGADWRSRDPSPHRWARASGASTSPCARSSTSTSACAR